jgi:quinol monooxygenase YgiN
MHIVQVYVHLKPEFVDDFISATLENARKSVKEPGMARFDVLQQHNDPYRFILTEVYRTPQDPAHHKQTTHYQTWRDRVEEMMAEPRSGVTYNNLYPEDTHWG